MKSSHQRTLLVTGASGHLGRRAVEHLLAHHRADRVVAGSRDPDKLAALGAAGAEARLVDFDRPETLADAFVGVDRVLIVSTDAAHTPGVRARQHAAAIAAARQVGVRHVVYTSLINAVPASVVTFSPDHVATECTLAESGLGYTILRNTLYAEVLLAGLKHALPAGQWFAAAGTGGVGYVTREDCAVSAAEALASKFEGRRTLTITGPEVVTHAQVAEIVTQITGRTLAYVPVTPEAVVAALTGAGFPSYLAEGLASFDAATAKGELALATSSVRELTGREPTSLRDFLLANLLEPAQTGSR